MAQDDPALDQYRIYRDHRQYLGWAHNIEVTGERGSDIIVGRNPITGSCFASTICHNVGPIALQNGWCTEN